MKKLLTGLALLATLVIPATLPQSRRSTPRLSVDEEFRPPVRNNCSKLRNQRQGAICIDGNDGLLYAYTDKDGDGTNSWELLTAADLQGATEVSFDVDADGTAEFVFKDTSCSPDDVLSYQGGSTNGIVCVSTVPHRDNAESISGEWTITATGGLNIDTKLDLENDHTGINFRDLDISSNQTEWRVYNQLGALVFVPTAGGGGVSFGDGTDNPSTINFYSKVVIKPNNILSINGVDYTWPNADGSSGYFLTTNGGGTLSWTANNVTDVDCAGCVETADLSSTAYAGAIGRAASGVPIDLDGDGTDESKILRQHSRPCIDLGGGAGGDNVLDGTCDWYWALDGTPQRADGSPVSGRPPLILFYLGDVHSGSQDGDADGTLEASDSDLAWAIVEARDNGRQPIGWALQVKPHDSSFGVADEIINHIWDSGQEALIHTSSHGPIGIPHAQFSKEFGDSTEWCDGGIYTSDLDGDGTNEGGTLTCTAATDEDGDGTLDNDCTGASTSMDDDCGDNYTPPWSLGVLDTDGDGTIEYDGSDWMSYVTAVDPTGQTVTFADTVPDLTSATKFAFVMTSRQAEYELEQTCSYLESATTDSDYKCQGLGTPGGMAASLGLDVLWAMSGLEVVVGSPWDGWTIREHEEPGNRIGTFVDRLHIPCDADLWTNGLETHLEKMRARGGGIVAISGHVPVSTCATNAQADYIHRSTYTSLMQWMETHRADGTIVVLKPSQAIKLARVLHGGADRGVNLVARPDFGPKSTAWAADVDGDGTKENPEDVADVGPYWPWSGVPDECSYDATADALNCTADGSTRSVSLWFRGDAGKYKVLAHVVTDDGYATGNSEGVRLCLYTRGQTAYNIRATWLNTPVNDLLYAFSCSYYQGGAASGNREGDIWGFFEVPQELDGIPIQLKVEWSSGLASTEFWINNVTVIRAREEYQDVDWGFGAAYPQWHVVQAPMTASSSGPGGGAITYSWEPNTSTAQSDSPTLDFMRLYFNYTSGRSLIATVPGTGVIDLEKGLRLSSETSCTNLSTDADGDVTCGATEIQTITLHPSDAVLDVDYDGTASEDPTFDSALQTVDFDGDDTDESADCGSYGGQCAAWVWEVPEDYTDNGLGGTTDIEIEAVWSRSEAAASGNLMIAPAIRCRAHGQQISVSDALHIANQTVTLSVASEKFIYISTASCTACDTEIDPGDTCWVVMNRRDGVTGTDTYGQTIRLRAIRLRYGVSR